MHPKPVFSFFLDGDDHPVQPGDDLWRRPLPLAREAAPAGPTDGIGPETGDYFRAVEAFLSIDNHRHLNAAFSADECSSRRLPESVHIHLVKHGAFYHPSRVVIHAGSRQFHRVVNVAVSSQGKAVIAEETAALRHLQEHHNGVLPKIYGMAEDIGAYGMSMFMADWLEGFCEWHLTGEEEDRLCRRVVVWDPMLGHHDLTPIQTAALFRRSAAVLTGFYDVATSGHVARWHHGAGDFIIRPIGDAHLDMRLITVRRYAPLMSGIEDRPEEMIDALLAFFLELTLKNRVDRRDGVGDMVLAETTAVGATVNGFFDGLADQVTAGHLPGTFVGDFRGYIAALGELEIVGLAASLIERLPPGSGERELYDRHGDTHVIALMSALTEMGQENAGKTTI